MKSHFEEKLKNWGDWVRRDEAGGSGYGSSPLASLMAKAVRTDYGAVIPLDEIDASKTDQAVKSLMPELQKVARLWYVSDLSIRQMALQLGCSTTTVPVRVEQVRHGIQIWYRERDEARRRLLAHDGKKSFVT